ncbi:MAG: hypothetical protein JKY67_20565 [Pseudomonadales bacterium]|nr:hypothetical protein [Pseudomonadales bacterium]
MSDQENVSKQQAKKEAFFVNFNADNAQFYLRRFRYVGSEESDELALAADCFVEYGKPRTKGQYKGKRKTSPCSIYFKGDIAIARAEELIAAYGIEELGQGVYISARGSLGDLRSKVWFGTTNGQPDINKANPYIAANLFRLDEVSCRRNQKDCKWESFDFVTQPPTAEEGKGEGVVVPSADSTLSDEEVSVSECDDQTHGVSMFWLRELIDQAKAGDKAIAFQADHEVLDEAANVFVKMQALAPTKNAAEKAA